MAREAVVCNRCQRNCLLLHGRKHNEPLKVTSFFNVMFGKNFFELLIVPPKHSRMLSSMLGKRCCLEDSTSEEWEVVLSDLDGCFAFKDSWKKFCIDHDIKLGDFLVFHLITESHVLVTIYGRSGWEKDFHSELSYKNEKTKTTPNPKTTKCPDSFYDDREPQQDYGCFDASPVSESDTDSIPSQDSLDSLEFVGEPCFMIDKETPFARENDREHFELHDMKSSKAMKGDYYYTERQFNRHSSEYPDTSSIVSSKGDEGHLSHPSTCKKTAMKVDANHIGELQRSNYSQVSGPLHKVQAGDASMNTKKRLQSSVGRKGDEGHLSHSSTGKKTAIKLDANHTGKLQKSNYSQASPVEAGDASINTKKSRLSQGHAAAPTKETEANLMRSKCGPVRHVSPGLNKPLNSIMPHETIKKLDTSKPSALSGRRRTMGVVKTELTEFEQDLYRNKKAKSNHGDLYAGLLPEEDDMAHIVKSEPVDFDHASEFSKITCSIPPGNESFLELPEPLPVKKRRTALNINLILLRNSAGKIWPVIYHSRNGFKVLASGWNVFIKANNIHPGDGCVFEAYDLDKGIFSVHILH